MLPFFLVHCYSKMFQTLHDYNLASGLHFGCRFDDLGIVARSHGCQKYKIHLVLFRFLFTLLSTVV